MPTSRATSSIVGAGSSSSCSRSRARHRRRNPSCLNSIRAAGPLPTANRNPQTANREPRTANLLERSTVEQIVIAGRLEARAADRQRDLRPVPRFVEQAVEEQLPRREHELAGLDRECPRLIVDVLVEIRDELIELVA